MYNAGFPRICQQKIPYFFHTKICSKKKQAPRMAVRGLRSEFAYYVPRILNRTVLAYRTSVQVLKRTVPTYPTRIITKRRTVLLGKN